MNTEQILREAILIGIVLGVTGVAWLVIRRSGGTASQNAERVLSGVMGSFLLLGGVAKFFMPFTNMFAQQIALSELPFPRLSAFAGQAGEISVGLVLLGFFILGRRLQGQFADAVFYLTNLVIVVIMLVAVYVHLHPNVPAEVLPFQSKPPVVTLIVMGLAMVNAWLRRRNTTMVAVWA